MKNGILTALLVVMGLALLLAYRSQSPAAEEITVTDAVQAVQAGRVKSISISGNKATVVLLADDKKQLATINERNEGFEQTILDYNRANPGRVVDLKYAPESQTLGFVGSLLLSLLPVLLIGGFFIYMMRQAQGTNNQAMSFGKSRARMFIGNKPTTTFEDVAGVDEAKQELAEVLGHIEF